MNPSTNYDEILKDVRQINKNLNKFKNKTDFKGLTYDEFKTQMETEFEKLNRDFNFIFSRAISGNLDNNMFEFMIQKAKSVQNNKMSNYDASKQVGEKLVDKFIKPEIEKNKSK